MIDRHPLTRRTVLKSLGAIVALPRLESQASAAAVSRPPVRLGFVCVPNGVDHRRRHVESPAGPLEALSPALEPLAAVQRQLTFFFAA